jgi:hypothetical protein
VRAGAMELGKVLTPESRLLHVVPGGQEAGENRCNGIGQGAYPGELPPPCCAGGQEAGENRCNGTGQGAYPGEPPPPCCVQEARSG